VDAVRRDVRIRPLILFRSVELVGRLVLLYTQHLAIAILVARVISLKGVEKGRHLIPALLLVKLQARQKILKPRHR
jgi:hypothetical protein